MIPLLAVLAMPLDAPQVTAKPGLVVNLLATADLNDLSASSMAVQRARPNLKGQLYGPSAQYFLQAEFAGAAPRLLDAAVTVRLGPDWLSLKTGRFLPPVSRSQLTPIPILQFDGFTPTANAYREGRDVGAQLRATPMAGRMDLRAAVFQGQLSQDGLPYLTARASFEVLGAIPFNETTGTTDPSVRGLSVAGGLQRGTADWDGVMSDATTASLDFAAQRSGLRLQSEAMVRTWDKGERLMGVYVQGSTHLFASWELALRADLLGEQRTAQGVLIWYAPEQHLRASLQYSATQLPDQPLKQTLALQQQLWF